VAAKPVLGGKTKPTFAATCDQKGLQIKRLLDIPGAKQLTFVAQKVVFTRSATDAEELTVLKH